jgi:hypothetical protein
MIAREYLGRPDGILFYDPLPNPNEEWQPYDELLEEDARLINENLLRKFPEVLDTIVRKILIAQCSGFPHVRDSAQRLLVGISDNNLKDVIIDSLRCEKTVNEAEICDELKRIYSSKTWKAGKLFSKIFDAMPAIIQKPISAYVNKKLLN